MEAMTGWQKIVELFGERSRFLSLELARLEIVGEVSEARVKLLYSKRTLRSLQGEVRELAGLKKLSVTYGMSQSGKRAAYFKFSEILALAGGKDGVFHRWDYPEIFEPSSDGAMFGKPSVRFRAHRTAAR